MSNDNTAHNSVVTVVEIFDGAHEFCLEYAPKWACSVVLWYLNKEILSDFPKIGYIFSEQGFADWSNLEVL